MPLTRPETMEHIGEMLAHAIPALAKRDPAGWPRKLMRFAKHYVINGSHGTRAERREAMVTLKKQVFKQLTGLDPVVDEHVMTHHWLVQAEEDDD